MSHLCLFFFPELKMEPSVLHTLSEQCTSELYPQSTTVFLHISTGGHWGYFLFMLTSTKLLQMSLDMSSLGTHIFISLDQFPEL